MAISQDKLKMRHLFWRRVFVDFSKVHIFEKKGLISRTAVVIWAKSKKCSVLKKLTQEQHADKNAR